MRILLVVTGLGIGGAERLLTGLADRFVANGHDVTLAYFHGPADLKPADSRVRLVDLGMTRRPLALARSLSRLRRLVREFDPDVVNSHLVHANILLRLLRMVTPMPRLVSSAHTPNEGGRLRILAYRLTDRLADISTNVSEEAVQAFVDQGALTPGRMITILNGIDARTFVFNESARDGLRRSLAIEGRVPVLLAVGRLWAEKDYPNLVRALKSLQDSGLYPRVLIAGDGPLRSSLVDLANSLGVAAQVQFLGVRHDISDLMSACDVFVLSSAFEGFGLVVAEAMACERVVVATDCGGVKEVVGPAGILVAPRNDSLLAKGLQEAMNLSPEERVDLGKKARARVLSKFSLQRTAEQYLSTYLS